MGGWLGGKRWMVMAVAAGVIGGWLMMRANEDSELGFSTPEIPGVSGLDGRALTAPGSQPTGPNDPARYASLVVDHARAAAVSPHLLMAILYNESYKPHSPSLERMWQMVDQNPALGVANMHKPAFDDAKRGRSFEHRGWNELAGDPSLAIQAAAWHLHDLAAQLPADHGDSYTVDELLALGYNAGGGTMRAYANGAEPVGDAREYLDRLRKNWDRADAAIR